MSEQALKATLQVTAGIITGEKMEEFTRTWSFTYDDMGKGNYTYLDGQGAALNYAASLMNPGIVNWVRFSWIWV